MAMDLSIQLDGGPHDGELVDLVLITSVGRAYPRRLLVSRAIPSVICTAAAVVGWRPETIAMAFRSYQRTEVVTAEGRRIYRFDAGSEISLPASNLAG